MLATWVTNPLFHPFHEMIHTLTHDAQILYLLALVFSTITVLHGGGRHLYYLSPEEVSQVVRWEWITQPFGPMALAFAKASITFLLLRIIGPKTFWRKWFLWINMVFFFIISILAAIFNYAQCNPPRALWEKVPGAVCWNPTIQPDFATFHSCEHTLVDTMQPLLTLPSLQHAHRFRTCCFTRHHCVESQPKYLQENWAQCSTRAGRLVSSLPRDIYISCRIPTNVPISAGICAAIKTAQLHELGSRADITWETFSLYAWSS